jgi:hypothetical protein
MIPWQMSDVKKMSALEIVWRNPNRVRGRRRHTVACGDDQCLYVLQEFVHDDHLGHWATISRLEVMSGGRAA